MPFGQMEFGAGVTLE